MLRAAFVVNSLSHCSCALRVLWKDGAESVYPSTWLRSTVRDERFFNQTSLMYEASHLSFAASTDATLKNASVTKSEFQTKYNYYNIYACFFLLTVEARRPISHSN